MKNNNSGKAQLISAILWAGIIIASSIVLGDSKQSETMFILLIVGATIQMGLMSNLQRSMENKKKKSCSLHKA